MDNLLFQELAQAWKNGFTFNGFSRERYTPEALGLVLTSHGQRLSLCERTIILSGKANTEEFVRNESCVATLIAVAPTLVLCLFTQDGMFNRFTSDIARTSSGLLVRQDAGYRIKTFASESGDQSAIVDIYPVERREAMLISIVYGRGDGDECWIGFDQWASTAHWIDRFLTIDE